MSELPEQGFPRELAARAQAVAVFPLVTKQTVLFQQTMEGYGFVSSRQSGGWSLPAFYKFVGSGYTGKFAGESKMAVILLFMNQDRRPDDLHGAAANKETNLDLLYARVTCFPVVPG